MYICEAYDATNNNRLMLHATPTIWLDRLRGLASLRDSPGTLDRAWGSS